MIEWMVRKFLNEPKRTAAQMDRRKDHVTRRIMQTLDDFTVKFQYYEAVIQTCHDCIARARLDGQIIFANQAYSQMFCGVEDISACHEIQFLEQVHEADLDKVKADMEAIQLPPYQLIRDHRVYDHKGDVRFFNWHVFGIRNRQGDVYEIQCIGREFPKYVQWADSQCVIGDGANAVQPLQS